MDIYGNEDNVNAMFWRRLPHKSQIYELSAKEYELSAKEQLWRGEKHAEEEREAKLTHCFERWIAFYPRLTVTNRAEKL